MKRTLTLIAPLAAVVAFAGVASAQDAAIDINGDGMYSFAELRAAMPDMTEDTFTVLDVSGDGMLDAEEIEAGTVAGLLPT